MYRKLELIKTTESKYYWCFDEDMGYLNSISYDTKKEALQKLISNDLTWVMVHINKDKKSIWD